MSQAQEYIKLMFPATPRLHNLYTGLKKRFVNSEDATRENLPFKGSNDVYDGKYADRDSGTAFDTEFENNAIFTKAMAESRRANEIFTNAVAELSKKVRPVEIEIEHQFSVEKDSIDCILSMYD
jgi:hypothetical protein